MVLILFTDTLIKTKAISVALKKSFTYQRRYNIRRANKTLKKSAELSSEKKPTDRNSSETKKSDFSTAALNNEECLKENSVKLNAQFKATTMNYVSIPTNNHDSTLFEHRIIENSPQEYSSDDNNFTQPTIITNVKKNEKISFTKKHSLNNNEKTSSNKKKKKSTYISLLKATTRSIRKKQQQALLFRKYLYFFIIFLYMTLFRTHL